MLEFAPCVEGFSKISCCKIFVLYEIVQNRVISRKSGNSNTRSNEVISVTYLFLCYFSHFINSVHKSIICELFINLTGHNGV